MSSVALDSNQSRRRSAAAIEPVDLQGMPVVVGDRVEYVAPSWFPTPSPNSSSREVNLRAKQPGTALGIVMLAAALPVPAGAQQNAAPQAAAKPHHHGHHHKASAASNTNTSTGASTLSSASSALNILA